MKKDNEENPYKAIVEAAKKEESGQAEADRTQVLINALPAEMRAEAEENLASLKKPEVLASLMYRTVSERENTNRVLKTLLQKIEALEAHISRLGGQVPASEAGREAFLSPVDEKILAFVTENGKACAADICGLMGYRNQNAAAQRLNRLFAQDLLLKKQVGRRVYYLSRT